MGKQLQQISENRARNSLAHAGVPFEESKRKPLVPLLYFQHALMLAVVAFTCYGTYAISDRPPVLCNQHISGLLNPTNATTAVVCAMWAVILVFM